jgi:hypothetical protein
MVTTDTAGRDAVEPAATKLRMPCWAWVCARQLDGSRVKMGCLENGTEYVPPASHIVQANLAAKTSDEAIAPDWTLLPTARAPMFNLTSRSRAMRGLLVRH